MSDTGTDAAGGKGSGLREQRDMLDELIAVDEEYAAAYETRDSDPARWKDAKQARADKRRFYRQIREYLNPAPEEVDGDGNVTVAPAVATGAAQIQGTEV